MTSMVNIYEKKGDIKQNLICTPTQPEYEWACDDHA
jgi:hypothetical protein